MTDQVMTASPEMPCDSEMNQAGLLKRCVSRAAVRNASGMQESSCAARGGVKKMDIFVRGEGVGKIFK